MTKALALVVFSDLDGTLLDHETYSWDAARPAMDHLAQLGVPLVLASSKTAAEITVLQEQMGLSHWPAIVENGAGLLGDDACSVDDYARIRAALDEMPTGLRAGFTGFGDMSTAEVSACTGLPAADAARAKQRMFSEPGLWSGDTAAQDAFLAALAAQGIAARSGGRFLTLSFGKTKADQMAQIFARYRPRHSIALGDAPNDREMLETAEYGVIIANPHRAPLPALKGEATGHISRTALSGPSGWNLAMMDLLQRLDLRA